MSHMYACLVAQSCLIFSMSYSLPGSSVHGNTGHKNITQEYHIRIPHKNTRVVCHSLLQRIFLTQGSNLGFLHCWQTLYHLNHQRNRLYVLVAFILCASYIQVPSVNSRKDLILLMLWYLSNT